MEKHQVKRVTGYSSPGLQIRVALWPHCPDRLVEGWKEDGAGMDQCGHKKKNVKDLGTSTIWVLGYSAMKLVAQRDTSVLLTLIFIQCRHILKMGIN